MGDVDVHASNETAQNFEFPIQEALVNPALQEIVVCERDNPQKVFDSFPL
jgi:hypothetical protein